MQLLVHLALRSLLRSRLAFGLLVAAVTAGVCFQIPNAANLAGYTEELLRQGMERMTGHLQVIARDGRSIEGAAATLARLARRPGLRAVVPRLVHGGVAFKGGEHQPVRIQGIDPAAEERATGFCRRLGRGRCMKEGAAPEAVLGSALAARLKVGVGDRVKVLIPYQELGEVEQSSAYYRVSGVLEGGGAFTTDSDLFLALPLLQRVVGVEDAASVISIYLDDHADAGPRAAELRPLLPRLEVKPWWEVSQFVASAIAGNRAIYGVSMAMVVAAVMIPVSALLFILVLHERRQIAILGALGFSRPALFAIYMWKAALVGLIGVGLGSALGYALCRYFMLRPIFEFSGFVVRPALKVEVFAVPSLALFAVTLLSGLVPALRAARCEPALGLRED